MRWDLLAFVGRLVLLGIIFLLPIILLVLLLSRITGRALRWLVSVLAVDLSFFLCLFVGLRLDPNSQHLSLQERLLASLLVVLVLTVIISIVSPMRKIVLRMVRELISRWT
jgi:Na+/proline symporter